MKKYKVAIEERLYKVVEVYASSPEEAEEIAANDYDESNITLDNSNLVELTIEAK